MHKSAERRVAMAEQARVQRPQGGGTPIRLDLVMKRMRRRVVEFAPDAESRQLVRDMFDGYSAMPQFVASMFAAGVSRFMRSIDEGRFDDPETGEPDEYVIQKIWERWVNQGRQLAALGLAGQAMDTGAKLEMSINFFGDSGVPDPGDGDELLVVSAGGDPLTIDAVPEGGDG